MSIQEIVGKCKGWAALMDRSDVATILIIVLVAGSSFGLGRLSKTEGSRTPITIENIDEKPVAGAALTTSGKVAGAQNAATQGTFVASKNGTKYYYPWCSGASRIKEENMVWFDTKEEAERAGFAPAANCSGL